MRKHFFYLLIAISTLLIATSCEDEQTLSPLPQINKGADFLSFDFQARTGNLMINSASAWEVTSNAEWCKPVTLSAPKGRTKLGIELSENTGEARYATLLFKNSEGSSNFIVSQSAANQGYDSPTHYFYITMGTMPTLYAGLMMLSRPVPSYVFYERTNTFDATQFPSYVTISPYMGANDQQADMRTYMKKKILEINREDPTAVFGLVVDDLRARIGYDWFVAQGIDSSRVKVTLVSDGTATYNKFYEFFGNAASAQSQWDKLATTIDGLDWNHSGLYPVSRSIPEFESYGWVYNLITRPNYRLLLQYDNLFETDSQFIKDKIPAMDMLSIPPYDMLTELTEAQRTQFTNMAMFDKDKFKAMFDASAKPNLVIIGTNGDASQESYVRKIYDQYGATYDIFFKPHPSDATSAGYETTFPGLTLLPGQMPFEIFVWTLMPQIDMIGGFQSTVFLTVPVDKVKFIFAPNAASLPRPLNLLFADATGVEWIQ